MDCKSSIYFVRVRNSSKTRIWDWILCPRASFVYLYLESNPFDQFLPLDLAIEIEGVEIRVTSLQ